MFSGIVEERATVRSAAARQGGMLLVIESGLDQSATRAGDSIAIDGVCLTVTDVEAGKLRFDLSPETVRRTTLGALHAGQRVNLERALVMGSRISGHLVSGHIDGTTKLLAKAPQGDSVRLVFELPQELRPFIAQKGSIALSGVSLTVGEVEERGFTVYIIPHTGEVTTLTQLSPGDPVNVEVDLLARYVVNALSAPGERSWQALLEEHGFMTATSRTK